jgi:hypothetical protein
MKADDYGRFHADPRLIKGNCFPLLENLRTEHIGRWLDELSHRNLVFRYDVGHRKLLAIINFGQRLKQSRPKFPDPKGELSNWFPELPGTSRNFPSEANTYSEANSEAEAEAHSGELPPPAQMPEIPSWLPKSPEQAVSTCAGFPVDPDFVREVWIAVSGVGFRDAANRQITSFPAYIQKRWGKEEMEWRAKRKQATPRKGFKATT